MSLIDIVVIRDEGNNQGPDIIEPLLGSVPIAIICGQSAIDDSESRFIVTLRTQFVAGVEMGQIIEVHDIVQGAAWRGKIVGITHTKQGAEIFSELEILRPARFA